MKQQEKCYRGRKYQEKLVLSALMKHKPAWHSVLFEYLLLRAYLVALLSGSVFIFVPEGNGRHKEGDS
jgi:hypothetical protein